MRRPGSSAATSTFAAIDQSRGCVADQDCVTLEIASACFESCTHSVASNGVVAVKAARIRGTLMAAKLAELAQMPSTRTPGKYCEIACKSETSPV